MSASTRFNRIFSYFVIVLSVGLLIGALLFFTNAGDEPIFSLFGIMLLAAAVFMLFAARKTSADSRKTELKEAQFEQAQNQQKESETILADWTYSSKEWHRTTRLFRRVNRSLELIVSLGIAALFIVLTFVFKDEGILLAGIFVAILYLIIRLAMARNIYRLITKEVRSECFFSL